MVRAVTRQRASGCRAIVRGAEEGASTSPAARASDWNGAARRSATATRIATPARCAVWPSRRTRSRRASPAITRAPPRSSATALPPGAAQASYTTVPGGIAAKRQTSAWAGSCTTKAPSAYPGNCAGDGRRDAGCVAPVSTTTPAPKGASRTPKPASVSRAWSVAASQRAGCSVRGARESFQAINCSVSLRPNCALQRSTSQRGWVSPASRLPLPATVRESFRASRAIFRSAWLTNRAPPSPAASRASSTLARVPAYAAVSTSVRSEEHTSELQSHSDLVCRLLLEKKKKIRIQRTHDNLTPVQCTVVGVYVLITFLYVECVSASVNILDMVHTDLSPRCDWCACAHD